MKHLRYFFTVISIIVFVSCAKDIVDLTGDIKGTVKDYKTGELISNCGVSLSPGGKSTTTNQYGEFSFNDLEAGDYTLSFSKSGYDDETKDVTVVAGQVSSTSVMLKESSSKVGSIVGCVKDYNDARLISNCQVSLSPGGKTFTTSTDGKYEFNGLIPGEYSLSFSKSEYDDETRDVTVVTGQTSSVSVLLKKSSSKVGLIKGVIKDYDDARLLSNCQVALSPGGKTFTTSSDGKYEFNGLTPGEYSLSFSKSGYDEDSKSVTVKAGEATTVDCLLKAKSSFSLSETNYDFGDLEDNKTFYCYNNSSSDCSYSITNIPDWLSFSKTDGTVKYDSNDSFTVVVDRTKVGEGSYTQTVNIAFSGKNSGTVTLTISMKKVVITTPTVNTGSSATNITQNSFDISGTIIATGGAQIIEYGHCWSTSPSPTVNDKRTNLGITSESGPYVSNVTGLAVNTTYYVRAYAKNSQGISYSNQITVTTQDTESDKWDGNIATSFAGGSGTSVDPYIIKTGGQLLLMKDYSNKSFKLDNNIDLDNHNWLPFGFNGTLDGAGNTIKNLRVSRDSDKQGLFSTFNGTIKNLNISGIKIDCGKNQYLGALAGIGSGNVSNVTVEFTNGSIIRGYKNVGGLIGGLGRDLIINKCKIISYVSESIILGDNGVGGLLGNIDNNSGAAVTSSCKISDCHVKATIAGEQSIGGIIGYVRGAVWHSTADILNCSFIGSINGRDYVGGIIGCFDMDTATSKSFSIKSSKVDAILASEGYASGIIGYVRAISSYNPECGSIIACYTNGKVNAVSYSSGLVISGVVQTYLSYSTMSSESDNFYQCGIKDSCHNCIGSYGCENITAYLKETYSDYMEYFNFNNTWTWTGKVDGVTKSVSCPKLVWE